MKFVCIILHIVVKVWLRVIFWGWEVGEKLKFTLSKNSMGVGGLQKF